MAPINPSPRPALVATERDAPLTAPALEAVAGGAPVVELLPLAVAWNAEKLLLLVSTALMTKTIPDSQWFACLQYAQIGEVLFTVMLNSGNCVALAGTNWNPESNPAPLPAVCVRGWQGAAKEDCVMVWFLATNWNTTTSLTAAVTSLGLNASVPFAPTTTVWVAAAAAAVPEGAAADGTATVPVGAGLPYGLPYPAALLDELACKLAPIANAAFLKSVKEVLDPSGPQLTAKTIP